MGKKNVITETLVKQQKLSSLPPLSIPIFNGNPLDYQFFLRAFEHGIEEKTENSKDRLYFWGAIHCWPTKRACAQLSIYAI